MPNDAREGAFSRHLCRLGKGAFSRQTLHYPPPWMEPDAAPDACLDTVPYTSFRACGASLALPLVADNFQPFIFPFPSISVFRVNSSSDSIQDIRREDACSLQLRALSWARHKNYGR